MSGDFGPNRHEAEIEVMKADGTYDLFTLQYDFADAMARQMERLGLSEAQLARKVGVSKSVISMALMGECDFAFETLVKLARALDCKVGVTLEPVLPASEATGQ